jgi:hypothetical protein
MFTYSIAEHLKTLPWYAFSRTPHEVAIRVTEVCANKRSVTKSDYSKFDGTIGQPQRALEEAYTLRLFHPVYHIEMIEAQRSQYNLKGVTRHGFNYDTILTRATGSPETSVFNTLANAATAYEAYREQGKTSTEAWQALLECLFGGDDGLMGDIDDAVLTKVASRNGLQIKAEAILNGEMGVQFLARTYGPSVWYGDVNSMCDLPRQLSKIHVSLILPANVTPVTKLVEKCRGYLHSDANTPIIGPFVRKVTSLSRHLPTSPYARDIRNYNGFVVIGNYPNYPADWMQDEASRVLPLADPNILERWLSTVTRLEDLLSPPSIMPETPPIITDTVTINQEVHYPELENPTSNTKSKSKSTKSHSDKRAATHSMTRKKLKKDKPVAPDSSSTHEEVSQVPNYTPNWRKESQQGS